MPSTARTTPVGVKKYVARFLTWSKLIKNRGWRIEYGGSQELLIHPRSSILDPRSNYHFPSAKRGSIASLSPSPKRLKHRSVAKMNKPGIKTKNAHTRNSAGARGVNVRLDFYAQNYAARKASHIRPLKQHQNHDEIEHAAAKNLRQNQQNRNARQTLGDIDHAHHEIVGGAANVAGRASGD